MALLKSGEVPNGAVKLSEEEAVTYAWEMVRNWDSYSDTWALRWGPGILGAINSLSGLMINQHYRRKLKLGRFGHMSTLIPLGLLPGAFTALFHRQFVSTDMLLMKKSCPLCYELRSTAVQVGFGTVYTMILGSWSSLMVASHYSTYRLPSLVSETKQLWKLTLNITRPFYGTLTALFALQVLGSIIVPYFEMRNHLSIRKKIYEIEQKLENQS